MAWGTFEGDDFRILQTPLSTILSGPDVGISPHAVDHGSNWLVTETVSGHIKFFQLKTVYSVQGTFEGMVEVCTG